MTMSNEMASGVWRQLITPWDGVPVDFVPQFWVCPFEGKGFSSIEFTSPFDAKAISIRPSSPSKISFLTQ